jgi:tRNA (cmo5U34)-methyltransferase
MSTWTIPDHALAYLSRADAIPHRTEGEAVLLDHLPPQPQRILDLGTGDGRLMGLIKLKYPSVSGVVVDFSAPMLAAVQARFARR